MFRSVFFLSLFSSLFFGKIEDYFKKNVCQEESIDFQHVDHSYLINLDQRPEKLQDVYEKLSPYNLRPERFSAVYGWNLTFEQIRDVSLVFQPGMYSSGEVVYAMPPDLDSGGVVFDLGPSWYGHHCVSKWTSKGAIGCTLSHLSVLQDALDRGFETIWLLEDDICVVEDPRILSKLIEKLDDLVGKDGWDMLFTDHGRTYFNEEDPLTIVPMMWRPDLPFFDRQGLKKYEEVGDDFFEVGHRWGAHSIIFRKSGIEKVLNFYKERQIFAPIDNEYFFIEDLKAFALKYPIVSTYVGASDTTFHSFQN